MSKQQIEEALTAARQMLDTAEKLEGTGLDVIDLIHTIRELIKALEVRLSIAGMRYSAAPVLNSALWDCNCKTNYVHARAMVSYCPVCLAIGFEQPNSRQDEVNALPDEEDPVMYQ